MNPIILDIEIRRTASGVGLLLMAIAFIGFGAIGMHVYQTALKPLPNGTPDVVCWEMPQADLKGWKRVPEVERSQLSYRAANGRIRMREETSLQCRQYANGDSQLFLAREWWYRPSR